MNDDRVGMPHGQRDSRWRPLAFGVLVALVAVVGLAAFSGSAAAAAPNCGGVNGDFAGGTGVAGDEYQIAIVQHLQCMNHTAHLDKAFVLTGNIDASDTANWNGGTGFAPVGNGTNEFIGSFDGQSHTISDLTINRSSTDRVGLVGQVGTGGSIANVTLDDSSVTGSTYVGGLVGWNEGDVTTVNSTGNVSGVGRVGGLVGSNEGTVSAATVTGNVTGTGEGIGGLVGLNNEDVANSSATGNVTGEGDNVGGLVGLSNPGSSIDRSFATGNVDGLDSIVGGLVGGNRGTIERSYATGSVDGTNEIVGGLVGENFEGTVTKSFATGAVDEDGSASQVGGLVGDNELSTLKDSYWDEGTTGQAAAVNSGGTVTNVVGFDSGDGSPAPEMTGANAIENMDGFAFPDTWHATDSYPALAWEDTDPFYGVTVVETTSLDESRATFNVTVNVTNLGADGGSQTITLTDTDFSDTVQDSESGVGLDSGDSTELTLTWDDSVDDNGDGVVTVASDDDTATVTAWPYAAGNGTADNPYGMETWYHLDNVREHLDANYTIIADLDSNTAGYDEVASATANGGDGFDSIGDDGDEFTGTFDGQNHTISDLTINRSTESRVGLFGEVGTVGSVANVTLVDGSVTGSTYVGGLVGRNFGTVTAAATTGDVDGNTRVGGLVGINDGDVAEAYATGNVSGSSDAVGGLVGLNNAPEGSVTDSYATGTVTGDTDQVGGLVGENEGDVTNSYAAGTVSGNSDVGGLVGFDDGGSVTNSYWDVNTTNQTSSAASPNSDGLTTAEMTGAAAPDNMTGFDFASNWTTTDSYPHLGWAVEDLTLGLGSTNLEPGDTTQATVTLTLADGSTVTGTTVANYTSDDETVATVDNGTGTVSALVVGTTDITATFIGQDTRLLTVQAASNGGDDDDDDGASGGGGGGSAGGAAGQAQQFSFALVDGAGSTDLDAAIVSIEVDFADDDAPGTVTVEPSDALPDDADSVPDASGLAFVDVIVPPALTDSEATLQLTLDADALGDIDPADLVVYQYDGGAWTTLDTTVVSTADGAVVIEATTAGFSLFAVGPAAQEATPPSTPTTTPSTASPTTTSASEASPTPTATTTETAGQPGFGIAIAIFAMLAMTVLVIRRWAGP